MDMNRDEHPYWRVSWLDHVQAALRAAPFPWWSPLILFSALMFAAELILIASFGGLEMENGLPLGVMLIYALLPSYIFGFLFVIDRKAAEAVGRLQPVMKAESDLNALRATIANMPFWPAIFATVIGLFVFLFFRGFVNVTGDIVLDRTTDVTRWIRLIEGGLFWMLNVLTVYHAIRQLRIIDHIYSHHVNKDLLNQAPLYGLASITTFTAVGFALPASLVFFTFPTLPTDPLSLGLLVVIFLLSTTILVAPVYRLHQELEAEKGRRLSQNSASINKLSNQLHETIQGSTQSDPAEMEASFAALKIEREIIRKAPTWPWAPGSIRGVLAALLLPTVVWLIQQLLELMIS